MTRATTRDPNHPFRVVRGEIDAPVHTRQWYERPGRDDGLPEVWCYTDGLSYAPGETVTVHAIATAPEIEIAVQRRSLYPETVLRLRAATTWAGTPEDASVNGCGWPDVVSFEIGSDWPSGAYRITTRIPGADGSTAEAHHLIIVRPAPGRKDGRVLLVTSDRTWCAYNDWGGSNHYEGIVDPATALYAPRLSDQRPFSRGFVRLPDDAPRTLPHVPPAAEAPIGYPHMEWAWATGHSKKYASAGWANYERRFAEWAEAQGYAYDVATQLDLHARPNVLADYACVVFVGHCEYWSWEMRDAVDAYVEAGGHVARFAGNFLWQIRLENAGHTQVCHKYRARTDDPLYGTDKGHLTTNAWDAPETARPGHTTFGLDALEGVYAGWGGLARRGAGGFTLYRPDHWAFGGTRLGYGDVLGADGRVFGYEVDGLAHIVEDGLPRPVPRDTVPKDLEILAMGLARLREDGFGADPADLFVADDDAVHAAETLFGDASPETLASVNRGSGMIVHFTRGPGAVFHAGTTEWVAGLMRGDAGVERVTRNVLDQFLAG